ncbi:MAG TPA: class I SAM-dependent methyltransferase [Terriglobales bacterium]|nr:class I SAM-dependent methyltransferase [Terriglobales bacterium]
MASLPEGFAELKQRLRASWMAGDFGEIAKLNSHGAEDFVARLGLRPGMKVLDVACGTGNQSIPAARAGAEVTGLDIATNLLEQARQRAAEEKLKIEFIEGDAEKLPYEAASFDVVLSMFGAMFAPRPEVVAAELLRVCRPGGLIAMGNWTPGGFVGQMFRITAGHVPPPPGMPAPSLWGDEKVVTERLGGKTRLAMSRQHLLFDYPFAPSEAVAFFRKYFGPTKMTFARLDEAAQEALAADLTAHWTRNNEGDANHTIIKAEYLEVHATVV